MKWEEVNYYSAYFNVLGP